MGTLETSAISHTASIRHFCFCDPHCSFAIILMVFYAQISMMVGPVDVNSYWIYCVFSTDQRNGLFTAKSHEYQWIWHCSDSYHTQPTHCGGFKNSNMTLMIWTYALDDVFIHGI